MIDEVDAGSNVATSTIPNARYVPKADKTPSYKPPIENFADIEETAAKTLEWIKSFEQSCESQDQWKEFDKEMDIADEMFRAAADRSALNADQANQKSGTNSHVKLATYYTDLRSITAWENTIIFGNQEELPVVYEPLPNSPVDGALSAKQQCDYNNLILSYTFELAGLRELGRKALWSVNKYANAAVEMIWDYRKEKRMIKKPNKIEEIDVGGQKIPIPISWTYSEKYVVIADNPRFIVHDMKDVRFDAMIDDVQAQSYIRFRMQYQLSDIWALQKANEYKNVEKITLDELYQGENDERNVKVDRQENAGESSDANKPTNLFDIYRGYIRIPVDRETGKWNPKEFLPTWFEYAYVGDINAKTVAVRLSPLRWTCAKIPVQLLHSHEDDKGALHLGFSVLSKSLIAQEMTLLDMCNDNITIRNRVPIIAERGSLSVRTKTFTEGGNAIWWKTPGAQDPHELVTQDTTQVTVSMLNETEERRRRILGTTKAFMGEALGSRTSASEYLGVADQALKPALDDAKYKANQLLPFVAFWTKEMWSDVGDPKLKVRLTMQGKDVEVRPAGMFTDVGIRVTSVKQFQDNILRRKEETDFNGTMLPIALQSRAITPAGLKKYISQIMKARGFDNVDEILDQKGDMDAIHVADAENMNILWNGVYDLPQQGENDEVHLVRHKPYYATVSLAPEESRPPQKNMQMMALHIKMHENQMTAQSQMQPRQGGAMNSPARSPGEVAGDMMGAEGGTMGNATAPDTGRPPSIEQGNLEGVQ